MGHFLSLEFYFVCFIFITCLPIDLIVCFYLRKGRTANQIMSCDEYNLIEVKDNWIEIGYFIEVNIVNRDSTYWIEQCHLHLLMLIDLVQFVWMIHSCNNPNKSWSENAKHMPLTLQPTNHLPDYYIATVN